MQTTDHAIKTLEKKVGQLGESVARMQASIDKIKRGGL